MLFKIPQVLAALTLASSVLASPMPVQETGLQVRQESALAELSVEDIITIAEEAVKLIGILIECAEQHDTESKWIDSTVQTMRSQYPTKNVMIFHDQHSQFFFPNGQHAHYELDIGCGTQGYEIWVFDQGTFDRAGDGGYINWEFSGNFHRADGSSHVDFFPINQAASSKRDGLPAIIYDFGAIGGTNQSHIALHPPVTYTPPPPAAPMLPPSTPTSDKNGDDGNYLLECKAANGTTALGMAYYKNLVPHGGNSGQQPDDFELLAQTGGHASNNATATWSNSTSSSSSASSHNAWVFPIGALEYESSSTTVHWNLFGHAPSEDLATNGTAGFADNGFEHFWVYKDDGEKLFTKDQWTCNSLYFAW